MRSREDVGTGDVTVAATIPPRALGQARSLAKQDLVCAGLPMVAEIFCRLDPQMKVELHAADRQGVKQGRHLLHLCRKAGAILTGERTALNFLGRLGGVATFTQRFVEQLNGTRAKIRDTARPCLVCGSWKNTP